MLRPVHERGGAFLWQGAFLKGYIVVNSYSTFFCTKKSFFEIILRIGIQREFSDKKYSFCVEFSVLFKNVIILGVRLLLVPQNQVWRSPACLSRLILCISGELQIIVLEYIFDMFVGPKLFPMISNKVSMTWHHLGNLSGDIYRVFPITMGSLHVGNWIEPIPLKGGLVYNSLRIK